MSVKKKNKKKTDNALSVFHTLDFMLRMSAICNDPEVIMALLTCTVGLYCS